MSTPQTEANKDGQSTGLALATGSESSRKERAWRRYRESECFESDGKANAFSKGFDAGEVITPDKWNSLLGERDHLFGALRAIQRIWQTQSEACADNSRAAELMAEQARSATAYLDGTGSVSTAVSSASAPTKPAIDAPTTPIASQSAAWSGPLTAQP